MLGGWSDYERIEFANSYNSPVAAQSLFLDFFKFLVGICLLREIDVLVLPHVWFRVRC